FEDVQLDVVAEQIQRGCTEITADGNAFAGRHGHLAHQGGDGAFRVGTGDRDNRCFRVTREQLDIARQLHATGSGLLQRRSRQGQAGAHVELVGAAEKFHVQLATAYFDLRIVPTQGR